MVVPQSYFGIEESLKQAFIEVDALEEKLASDSELSVTAANFSILELKLRYHYLFVEYHVSVGTRESKVEALKHLTAYFKSSGSTHSLKLQLYFELRTDLGLEEDLDKGYEVLELNVGRRATYEAEYSAWIKSKSKAK